MIVATFTSAVFSFLIAAPALVLGFVAVFTDRSDR